jgi:hypothetical protein
MRRLLFLLFLLPAFPALAQNTDLLAPMSAEDAASYNPGTRVGRAAPSVATAPVTAAPLSSASTAGYGTLTGEKGGLSSSLWQNTEAGTVIPLLDEAGRTIQRGTLAEYILRELARRTALTHAPEPENNPPPGADFFAGRVILAASAGDPEGAAELAKTQATLIDEDHAQELSSLLLMQAKVIEACADPKLQAPAAVFWQKLAVICALGREGGKAHARRALDLMREGGETDSFFLDVAEQAASGKKKITLKTVPAETSILHAALLSVTGLPPPAAVLDPLGRVPCPLLLHVKGPEAWRAKIALELAKNYWVTAGTLKNLFGGFTLNAKTLASLTTNPRHLANPKIIPVSLRAPYALRAAEATEATTTKANYLSLLASLLTPEDLSGALGQLVVESMPGPESGMTTSAQPLARLAMMQGNNGAKDWYALAGHDTRLAPLAALRGLLPESEWANNLALYAKEQSIPLERRATALGLLEALGYPPGEKAAAALTALGARLPEAADDALLRGALDKKAEGEAILRTLLLSPHDTVSVLLLRIKALRALGFEKEAAELALPQL